MQASNVIRNQLRSLFKSYYSRRSFHAAAVLKDIFNVQDEEDFKLKVIESKIPVIVDFHASWCRPCGILAPRLEMIVGSKKEDVHLAKVDIDSLQELAMEYNVSSVPTVIGVKDGKVMDQFIGVLDDDKINSFVDKLIGVK